MSSSFSPITGIEASIGKVNIPETILAAQQSAQVHPEGGAKAAGAAFSSLLDTAVKSLSETQVNADNAIAQLAAGQNVELHSVMLAVEKANMTLQLALQIKNKITEAYQDIMRMQI